MNYKMVFSILGKTMITEAVLLLFPMLVGVLYAENNLICFLLPVLILLAVGVPLSFVKSKDRSIFAKEWVFESPPNNGTLTNCREQ